MLGMLEVEAADVDTGPLAVDVDEPPVALEPVEAVPLRRALLSLDVSVEAEDDEVLEAW